MEINTPAPAGSAANSGSSASHLSTLGDAGAARLAPPSRVVRGAGHRRRTRGDRGQATPLVALLVAMGIGVVVLLGHLGGAAQERAKAQAAADAAALAAATEGAPAARALAEANGATLEQVVVRAGEGAVRVRVGRATAVARARTQWPG